MRTNNIFFISLSYWKRLHCNKATKLTWFRLVYKVSDLTRDQIQNWCKLVALLKNYHYCNSLPIPIVQFIISLKILLNVFKSSWIELACSKQGIAGLIAFIVVDFQRTPSIRMQET